MKQLIPLLFIIVASQAIIITCTGCTVNEDVKYRDACKYCGEDGFIGADDVKHAESAGHPDAAQWKVGLCPYCPTGKSLLASTSTAPRAQPTRSASSTTASAAYQQPAAAPLPEPRVETTQDMAYVDSAGRCFAYGYLYNDSNRVLLHATVVCTFLDRYGTQTGTQYVPISYLQPGGRARWVVKTPISYTMQYQVGDYSYGN